MASKLEVDEILDTLPDNGDKDYDTAIERLNAYFSPPTNIAYEVYNFRQTKQKGESLDSYHTRLRQLAKTCEFSDIDKEFKEHVILTCGSNSPRLRAVRENLTLDALLKFGRALQLSEQQASQVEKATSDASVIKTKTNERPSRPCQRNEHSSHPRDRRSQSRNRQHLNKRNKKSGQCENFGGYAPHRNPCPAREKSCNACRKIGHFAHVCLSKSRTKSRTVAHVESGHLFSATVTFSSISTKTQLHVVKGNTANFLSYNTAQKLNVVTKSVNTATVTALNNSSPEVLQEEFRCLFGGIGKIRNKVVKLHDDPDVTPKKKPHRRIPFHVRGDVEKEFERLERLDINEKVKSSTPWISAIVVVPKKSGEVRICVDMREANKAIKREKHLMPIIDDLIADLNGATHFSTLDLSSGYHQLELSPESRFISTFSTHVGLRRYKRIPFAINTASAIFQESIKELLIGLPGCENISDNIIVFGRGKDEHDRNFRGVLQRLQDNNLRLNEAKCEFSKSEVSFYGHIFSSSGIKPDPKKVEAIHNASPS
ncbi:uncharacterized protein LOC141894234 [Acropora palmata]|uniref:uncharacterized protein LOC141894234 n=1 Tax=Acropora palmata TaxID=6131 RepID=UPI003D9FBE89